MNKRNVGHLQGKSFKERLVKDLKWNWILYVMIIPIIVYFFVFSYMPMYGIVMGFKDYNVKDGIMGSPWVGLAHFKRFLSAYNFGNLVKNTLTLTSYNLLVGFPLPIIFAVLLHHSKRPVLKKTVQMISYAPHFISTVVICGMIRLFLHEDHGMVNLIIERLGGESINFMGKANLFKHIYVWSSQWQTTGWSAIIYVSALAGVDQQLHEAALIDGATVVQRIRHVDLPSIKPTIVMLLIMSFPGLVGVGFEKVYLLQNDLNLPASQVISTYVYEQGMIRANYSYSAAVGFFNTVISLILLIAANTFSKKVLDESLF